MSASSRNAALSAIGKRVGISRHFALRDDAALVLVHELDRFLDRDDVPREVLVDVIDQRRQRGRFAGAGRPGHQDQAAAQMAEFFHDRRNAELIEGRDLRRDQTKDRAIAVRLLQEIAAKTRFLIHLVGEIEIAAFFENFPTFRPADFAQHHGRFFARDRLVADRHDVAVPAHLRRLPFADVQIGGAFATMTRRIDRCKAWQMTKSKESKNDESNAKLDALDFSPSTSSSSFATCCRICCFCSARA